MRTFDAGSKLRRAALVCLLAQRLIAAAHMVAELNSAARKGDIEAVRTLLAQSGDPNAKGPDSRTPLYYAVLFNRNDVASLLLAHHADPNLPVASEAPDLELPEMPLQIAASMGNLAMASMLLSAGARLEDRTSGGRTALHFAAVGLHPEMVRFLVEKGSNVNASDKDGVHPLDDTVWRGFLEETVFLLNHGARLDQPVLKTGATPLNEAAFIGQTATIRYLLSFKPNLETVDNSGYTPLENAVRMRHQDSAVALLEAKPYSDYAHSLNRFVSLAVRKDEALVVAAMIEEGLKPDATLPSGDTLLISAASLERRTPQSCCSQHTLTQIIRD